jgi:hypothetical protein
MEKEKICLECIRWEGRCQNPPLWKARCSQIDMITEQTAYCIFWVEANLPLIRVPSGGIQSHNIAPVA